MNTTDWKSKTCEGCRFRVEDVCRRFPPNYCNTDDPYPVVEEEEKYLPACAEYQSEEESQ